MPEHSQGHVRHHLGDWGETCHAHTVDEQLLPYSSTCGNRSRGMIAKHPAFRKSLLLPVVFAYQDQPEGQWEEHRRCCSRRQARHNFRESRPTCISLKQEPRQCEEEGYPPFALVGK